MPRKQILLTNDDGILSPGIWKAAEALSSLGFVTLVAPREQYSSAGRSMPLASDGKITPTQLKIGGQEWTCYAVGGSPAQSVLHAILEIMPQKPDLVVSGINYGENVGHSITISGTVGAALEGAAMDVPSMAVSLQLCDEDFLSYRETIDFSTAAYFTAYFARLLLEERMPEDVDVLKVEVPADATPQTPWRITRLARHRYWTPVVARRGSWEEKGRIDGSTEVKPRDVPPDTDVHTLIYDRMVSVTPLSLDMTSRVDLHALEKAVRGRLEQAGREESPGESADSSGNP